VSSPPLGMIPSLHVTDGLTTTSPLGFKDDYTMNQWVLMGAGDILLLHTDGLVEHRNAAGDDYYQEPLEQKLREVKHQTAAEIFDGIRTDLLRFGNPADDITLVVIKRM
jgi:sigma-B regulation protein RsbU (phosphoserine phosphatase)